MKKGIKVYQIIQYLISLFLCLMIGIFPGDEESLVFLSGPLKYLPIVLWGINLVCFILEFIKKRAYIRLIYLIVTSVIIAVSIPDYVLIGDMVIIFGLVYLIMMLVVTIKGETFVKAKEVADNNILQVGFFNRKQRKQTYLVFGLSFLVAFLVVFLLDICFEVGLLISMLIAFPLVFAFIMIGNVYVNPLQKAIKIFHKDLDFNKFESTILELKENNLHPDSLSYLQLIYTNYLSTVSATSSIEHFAEITKPVYKPYRIIYDMFAVINAINQEDLNLSLAKIQEFKEEFPNQKINIATTERAIKVFLTEETINDMEKLYPINKKFALVNVINANVLMVYYKKRHDDEKAQYYAKYVLDNTQTLTQYINDAKEVLINE